MQHNRYERVIRAGRLVCGVLITAGWLGGCDAGTGVQIPEGQAGLRVVNASPDAQALQVLIGTRSYSMAGFPSVTTYGDAPTGVRQLQVRTTLAATPLLTSTVGLQVDAKYTFVVLGRVESLQGIMLTDDAGVPGAGTARLRLMNAAQTAGTIDLYLTAPAGNIEAATPSLTNLTFRQGSAYLDAAAGTYRLRATTSGTKNVIMDVPSFTVAAGQVRTAVVVEAPGGGAPYSVLLLQDN